MLRISRSDSESVARAVLTAHNALHRDIVDNQTTYAHYDRISSPGAQYPYPASTSLLVTHATATTLATVRTMAIEIHRIATAHWADDITRLYGAGVHLVADTMNEIPSVLTTTSIQSAVNTWLNDFKASANLHALEPGVHAHDDVTNTISAADASDLATSITLVNAIKTWMNNHINSAPTAEMIRLES